MTSTSRGPGRPTTGERVHLRIPADVLARLDAIAERDGTSRAEVARRILADALD